MSDNESDYYSDSVESNEETLNVSNNKPAVPVINSAKKFGNYVEDESEADDSEPDDADIEEEDEEKEERNLQSLSIQIGDYKEFIIRYENNSHSHVIRG